MMKGLLRYVLYVVVAILAVLLVQAWQKEYPPAKHQAISSATKPAASQKALVTNSATDYVPPTSHEVAEQEAKQHSHINKQLASSVATSNGQIISVKTDLLHVGIDAKTGNVVDAQLLKFPLSLKDSHLPVTLFNTQKGQLYLAQSGLSSNQGNNKITYQASKMHYELLPGENKLTVVLNGHTKQGLAVEKRYVFERNHYTIDMQMSLKNNGTKKWQGSLYAQLLRQPPEHDGNSMFGIHSYLGASTSSVKTPYEKITFKKMQDSALSRSHGGGWVAMQQHYFLSAWVPVGKKGLNHFYTHYTAAKAGGSPTYIIGFLTPNITVDAGQTRFVGAKLYVGPESDKRLSALAPGLNHTLDYGFLWPISIVIQNIMQLIVKVLPNWGVAIILMTIIIKVLFYWFSAKSFISMAKMRELQPRIKALQERYQDDKAALQKATMSLYREKKVNPIGGCLPMLIQIPVFIALYYVITQNIDFRQAPFVFWIKDLSVADPYYVLPILMFFTMALQQWLSPTSADPTQAKMMWIMPIVFAFLFRNFPAGLVLYWCVNNLVQALQQWYVSRRYEQGKYRKIGRKKKRVSAR